MNAYFASWVGRGPVKVLAGASVLTNPTDAIRNKDDISKIYSSPSKLKLAVNTAGRVY